LFAGLNASSQWVVYSSTVSRFQYNLSLRKHPYFPYVVAVVSMLLWGMSFVWTAIVLETYPPVTVIFLRLLISCVFLFLFVYITGRIQRIRKEDLWLFLGSALFNPFFYFIGENYGVLLTSPTISAVIIATIPLFAPIAAFFYLRERLNILNISGLLISFSGILIMLLGPDLSIQTSPLGVLALMVAVFSAVAYSIFLKKLTARYSSVFIIAVQNFLGLLYFSPLFFAFEWNHFLSATPSLQVMSSIFALAVLCSSLAFILFTMAVRQIGVARSNVFANLIPVFTGVFSFMVIAEQLGTQKILGILVVVAGLFLSQIGRRKFLIRKINS
jgi:drug/metabolite transporter (DMT)-like permease